MNRIGFGLLLLVVLFLLLVVLQMESPGRFTAVVVFGVVWLVIWAYKTAVKKNDD